MFNGRWFAAASILASVASAGGIRPAQAASVEALQGDVCTAGQLVCLVPDQGWGVFSFRQTSYDAATDKVTGYGIYHTKGARGTGSETVYMTDGPSVTGIFTIQFHVGYYQGNERVKVTWQGDDNGLLDLGGVPAGGMTVADTGSIQDMTMMLAAGPAFPSALTVQGVGTPLSVSSIPEPSSLLVIGTGLVGAAAVRRRRSL